MKTRLNLILNAMAIAHGAIHLGFAQSRPLELDSEVTIEENLLNKPIPKWIDGSLVVLDNSSGSQIGISLFDRNGRKVSAMQFTVPGATYFSARSFTRSRDGYLALCGSISDAEGRHSNFVALMPPDGGGTKVVRTSSYAVLRVAFASDGTLWTQGREYKPRAEGEAPRKTLAETLKPDAAVFRQFDKTGKSLRSVHPQSEMDAPVALWSSSSVFTAVGDRIVFYSSEARQYIEILADGTVTHVKNLSLPNDERESGFAVTEKNELYISSRSASSWSVSRLNLGKQIWEPLSQGARSDRSTRERQLTLLGAQGATLAALSADAAGVRVRFFRIPE